MTKIKTSLTLTKEAISLLRQLAKKSGISMSAVLEILIREKAKAEDIKPE